jgi:hypothetical protein
MQIKVYPSDLVKRCVWDTYVYYVLGSEKEAKILLSEDKEMEISERDALVIGLLKVIETDNLIHKFNTYIVEILSNKSTSPEGQILIRKKVLDASIDKFLEKFPPYWECSIVWEKAISELTEYVEDLKNRILNIEIICIEDKGLIIEFYPSNNIRKNLKFSY